METKTIKTSGGHEVVLKSYLTGREMNEVMKFALKGSVINELGKSELSGESLVSLEEKALEFLAVSVDGNAENAFETICNLPASEYAEVAQVVYQIVDIKSFAEKKRP